VDGHGGGYFPPLFYSSVIASRCPKHGQRLLAGYAVQGGGKVRECGIRSCIRRPTEYPQRAMQVRGDLPLSGNCADTPELNNGRLPRFTVFARNDEFILLPASFRSSA